METFRLTWYNPFGHRSIESSFLGQIDQNAFGQSRVDWMSKLVKTTPKQQFSCFYIKLELIEDFCQLWSSLTWDWLPRMIEKPNFDPTIRMGGNQCHCKGYWIPFPTTIHMSKLELKRLKYHENCAGHISSLPKAITLVDHWIFELLRGCLVCVFKQPFSVFKQHFTYFYILFHPHVFSQMFSNNNFQFLNTYTKRTLSVLETNIHTFPLVSRLAQSKVEKAFKWSIKVKTKKRGKRTKLMMPA